MQVVTRQNKYFTKQDMKTDDAENDIGLEHLRDKAFAYEVRTHPGAKLPLLPML